jgi:Acetyltransferase (GNAT) domain
VTAQSKPFSPASTPESAHHGDKTEMNKADDLTIVTDDTVVKRSAKDNVSRTILQSGDLKVRVYVRLDDLPCEYDQFFEQMAAQSFFFSRPWFDNLARTTLENNTRLRLYAVESETPDLTPKALLITTTPAAQNGARIRGWWVRSSSLAGFTNYLSHTHTLLLPEPTADTAVLIQKIISVIMHERPCWNLIDLNLFDPDSRIFAQAVSACRNANMMVATYYYAGNRCEDTSHLEFDRYLNNRSKIVKKSLKQVKRLEKNHTVRFEMITNLQDAERAISTFDLVYRKSWKEEDYFKDFTPGVIRTCAAQDVMRIGILYVDDQPVAADFAIVTAGTAVGMKAAYDSEFAKYSVGSILHLYTIKYFIEKDHVMRVSFGLFDDPYKRLWCSQRRELWGVVAFNTETFWGKCGFVCYSIERLAEKCKQYLKPLLLTSYRKFIHQKKS